MPIETRCRSCGKLLVAPESAAGRQAKCPECGDAVEIPIFIVETEPEPALELDQFDEHFQSGPTAQRALPAPERPCPECGELIRASAIRCRFCDANLMSGNVYGAYPYLPVTTGLAVASLVLGILSLVMICVWFLSPLLAILSIVFAAFDMSASHSRGEPANGLAIAGLVLGAVTGSLWLVFAAAAVVR